MIGCDIDAAGLAVTAEQLAAANVTAELQRTDISVQADVDALMETVGDRVDLLANVAGIMDHFLPLSEVDDGPGIGSWA